MEEQSPPPSKKQKIDDVEICTETSQDKVSEDQHFSEDVDPSGDKFMFDEDRYTNFVTAEELDKLREFKILDEVKSDDEDSNEEGSESSDGIPEEEIEKMLEEGLPEDFKGAPKPKEKAYMTKKKVVLEEKGVNQFEVLPLDWMMVRHYSGMPVYMHRGTRVCTLAKPYFLGKGNTRRHDIPISAIPCLAYRRALEEEEKQKEIDKQIDEQIKSGKWQQNLDKNKQNYPTKRMTGTTESVNEKTGTTETVNEKTRCPYLLAKGIVQNGDRMPDNHEELKAKARAEENSKNDDKVRKEKHNSELSEDNLKDSDVESIDSHKESPTATETSKSKNDCDNPSIKVLNREVTIEQNKLINKKNETLIESAKEQEELLKVNKIEENIQIADNNIDQIDNKNENVNIASQNEFITEVISKDFLYEVPLTNGIETNSDIPSTSTSQDKVVENDQNGDASVKNENNENGDAVVDKKVNVSEVPLNIQPVVLPGGIVMPPPRVESVNTSWKSQHLTADQVNDYCKRLFIFKTIDVMHFRRWADRRKYVKARKTLQYPPLPEGTKLITIPAAAQAAAAADNGTGGKAMKRDWVMNMNGRSYLSVFHEYVRRALQKQPVYKFKQLENAATPYQATVYIGGMQYGVGHGSSKRSAKSAAARASIRILIPEMQIDEPPPAHGAGATHNADPDFSFFDSVSIEDPRITEFCAATCEPTPHAILRTCLLRNFGAGDKQIHTEIKKLEFQKVELTMKVGKHTATVVCKNKKSAKQRASQAILQMLHPHVHSWGSLLRLYGSRSVKSCKEKKLEEQQITLLQDEARHNEPNYAVLEKLKHEMKKLKERDEAVVAIGTMMLTEDLPSCSGSNLNNVEL